VYISSAVQRLTESLRCHLDAIFFNGTEKFSTGSKLISSRSATNFRDTLDVRHDRLEDIVGYAKTVRSV
jgi:hypothetical protein